MPLEFIQPRLLVREASLDSTPGSADGGWVNRSHRQPTQTLPRGMVRRYTSYEAASADPASGVPVTDVGGYDALIAAAEQHGVSLEVSRTGLSALDAAIGVLPEGLEEAVAMYFGDVVIRSIPGSQWRVIREGQPLIEVPGGAMSDVMAVARSRLADSRHALVDVLDHLAEEDIT
ncbi:hypothetical protein SAMN06295879_2208 [Agreia bicolorata]|uniref:Uncharacterized protein n=1 Tax=Agreia bicolorata TaxID=110935 RepID=A0A1T4Y3G4_9MICO|nr:DUF6278 family protein [Agreia bicolorata]SKA96349.1 hypothetical protein SAMN06295879_2208 [Agreia bicolorata]